MTTLCRAAALTAALLATATMAFPAIICAQARGATPTRACAVLTIAEIKQIAGTRIQDVMYTFPPMETPLGGGGSECEIASVTVQLDAANVSQFEARRKLFANTTFQPLAGVGDAAYFYEQGKPDTANHDVGVYTKSGTHLLVVSMAVTDTGTVAALRPLLTSLAQAALAKLK